MTPRNVVFDQHCRRYEKWFATHAAAYYSELLAIRALLPCGGDGLEVGVGTGRFAAPLGVRVGVILRRPCWNRPVCEASAWCVVSPNGSPLSTKALITG